ncbi:hypothetical protein JOF53_000888 [Crossiella equi]|uniref:V8-like Glu-specific endopeptidase n=1 Tax=Crossiella equi TaxID=130796 RepID=A0ABS5A637_9PSEU|nr:peptidase [Crossiella equi]MBP2472016.1 hypothetical protein [Crossiella equi]
MTTSLPRKRLLAAGLALFALVTAPLPAAAAEPEVLTHPLAQTEAARQAVREYWTPARIAAMAVGDPGPGAPPVNGPDGASVPTGTAVDRTVGRLFFVDRDGGDSSCTATLVRAANRGTLVTGGHCVLTGDLLGRDPKWHEKVLWAPGFRDNTMPHGSFVASDLVVHRIRRDDPEQSNYDQAFVVLGPDAQGREAEDALGTAQKIAFNLPGNLPATEFGYPRSAGKPGHQGRPEFTGMRVARCWGTPAQSHGSPESPAEPDMWGLPCDMGGGSSGGPRIALLKQGTGQGVVVGVNVQGHYMDGAGKDCQRTEPDCTRHLIGPQFTAAITGKLLAVAATM